jgi:hypothetical protein
MAEASVVRDASSAGSATLRKYELRPDKESAWAIIVIDTARGFFSAVSDHGNYGYLWTHPGGEFRAFLAQCEKDYVYSKLTHIQRVFDPEGTREAFEKCMKEIEEAQTRPLEWIERERDDFESVHSEADFYAWQSNTEVEDSHELYTTRKESGCWGFVTKLFTRFQAVLREELKREKEDEQQQKEKDGSA